MIVNDGKGAVLGAVDVEFDDIDAELDRRAERSQGVLRALIRVAAMTAEQDAAAPKLCRQALRVRDRHRPMLRELSRGFYIRGYAQEISEATVTPLTARARTGRISHDPSQDPIAGATTAGAGDGHRAAGAVPGIGAAASLRAGDGEGAWGRRTGAGRDQLQPPPSRQHGARLPQGLQAARGYALPRHSSQFLLGPDRPGGLCPARLVDERGATLKAAGRPRRWHEGPGLAGVLCPGVGAASRRTDARPGCRLGRQPARRDPRVRVRDGDSVSRPLDPDFVAGGE